MIKILLVLAFMSCSVSALTKCAATCKANYNNCKAEKFEECLCRKNEISCYRVCPEDAEDTDQLKSIISSYLSIPKCSQVIRPQSPSFSTYCNETAVRECLGNKNSTELFAWGCDGYVKNAECRRKICPGKFFNDDEACKRTAANAMLCLGNINENNFCRNLEFGGCTDKTKLELSCAPCSTADQAAEKSCMGADAASYACPALAKQADCSRKHCPIRTLDYKTCIDNGAASGCTPGFCISESVLNASTLGRFETSCYGSACQYGEKCVAQNTSCLSALQPGETVCDDGWTSPSTCKYDEECKYTHSAAENGTVVTTAACKSRLTEGQTTCGKIVKNSDDEIVFNGQAVCDWYQECKEKDVAGGFCVDKGNDVCMKVLDDESEVPFTQCLPSQSCCDGVCCNTGSVCEDVGHSNQYEYGQTYANRSFYKWLDSKGRPVRLDLLDRNDYVLPDGTDVSDKPKQKVCSPANYVGPITGVRAVAMPLFSTVFFIVFMGAMAKGNGMEPKSVRIPALLLFVVAIFLSYSVMWPYAFLFALTGALIFGCPSQKVGYLVIWQIISILISLSAFNLISFKTENALFETTSNGLLSAANCKNYFSYFNYDAKLEDWDLPSWIIPSGAGWGYCSIEWMTGIITFAFFGVLLQFVSLVFTVSSYGQDK